MTPIEVAIEFLKLWAILATSAAIGIVWLIRHKAPRDLDKDLLPHDDQVIDLSGRRPW